ncbi:hypothetical protein MRX96_009843 [Rhipicephalus microplus]
MDRSRRRAATSHGEVLPESGLTILRPPTGPQHNELSTVVAENWCWTSSNLMNLSFIRTIHHFSFYREDTVKVINSLIFFLQEPWTQ